MAIFSPKLSDAPSGFQPIADPADNTVPNAINQVSGLVGTYAKTSSDAREAQAEAEQAQAAAGLFSDTLRAEGEALQGQEFLQQNQERLDSLYADGQITAEEQKELSQLMQDRRRLENITNGRQRQIRLRMKYANFVNRFPHLTKEARIMFGDADSRLEDIAAGNQALVEKEAFESIYGNAYTAENVTNFRALQKYKASREVGTVYGEANFNDFSNAFRAQVTTDMYAVGQRMQALLRQQGALRQDDIDMFNAQVEGGYMDALRQIDATVLELQKNGQYVSPDSAAQLKSQIEQTKNYIVEMSKEKDFVTRLERFNRGMEAHFKADMNLNMSALGKLVAGDGGGTGKGAADLATIQHILQNSTSIESAKNLPAPYGQQLQNLQQGIVEYINFLDEYDQKKEEAARYISPALYRQLTEIQGIRIDNGVSPDKPEALTTYIDIMEQGGSSEEQAEAIISRAGTFNEGAIASPDVKTRLSSFVNNYALETEELLKGVGAKVRQTPEGWEAYITGANGKLKIFERGTAKLRNLQGLYSKIPAVGSMNDFVSIVDDYKNAINEEAMETVDLLNMEGMTDQMKEMTLKRLQTMYSLTDKEVEQIRQQLRSNDGGEE